ncbi:MAG: hypothetical protein ACI85F_001204 [Bacteroidia bacterium]|jgi:hypothetical protein
MLRFLPTCCCQAERSRSPLWFVISVLISLWGTKLSQAQTYFQQQVDHEIHVTLDDHNHILRGYELVNYTNNSPDTLNELWFHLWPNAYSGPNSAMNRQKLEDDDASLNYAKQDQLGWIDSLDFFDANTALQFKIGYKNPDITKIDLVRPILPGEKREFRIPFRVVIPDAVFSRFGHLEQAYQITQWYPKPAVYDTAGWHPIPNVDQGEYFSEFGTYDVHITLPSNYVVGATGDLQTESELNWLNQKDVQTRALNEFNIDDLDIPPSSLETKTLHYHQEKVHDFAWFADKRFHVLKDVVELPQSKRNVTTWSLFTNNQADMWLEAPGYLSDAIRFYSLKVGEYPYNQVTAVDGLWASGTDMEYPTITLIGEANDDIALDQVIAHEVGHNWFYGILANNEREYAWLDEGMNTYVELLYMRSKYPDLKLFEGGELGDYGQGLAKFLNLHDIPQDRINEIAARTVQRTGMSQPIDEHSEWLTSNNYGAMEYSKAGLVFDHLRAYVGEETMNQIMKTYFNKWKFKHPTPQDLQEIAEEVSGENLSWLFDDLIKTTKHLDYAISGIKRHFGDSAILKIRNRGQINAPFSIGSILNDSLVRVDWYPGVKKQKIRMECDSCDRFIIDPKGNTAEYNRKNNQIKNREFFRKLKPIRLQLLGGFVRPHQGHINWTPTIGWNNNDGFMVGGAIYNNLIPNNRFDYFIMPMYAFKAKALVGQFDFGLNISPPQKRWKIRVGVRGNRYNLDYGTYWDARQFGTITGTQLKINLKPNFHFETPIGSPRQGRTLFANYIMHAQLVEKSHINRSNYNESTLTPQWQVGFEDPGHIFSYSALINVDRPNSEITKFSLTFKANKRVNRIGTRFKFRTFLGVVAGEDNLAPYFRLSSWTPENDYLRDGYAANRGATNSDVFSKQIIQNEGAFRTSTVIGSSNKWLFSSHLNFRPHKYVPIELFFGFALFPGPQTIYPDEIGKAFEMGVSIIILENIIEMHIPFAWDDITGERVKIDQPRFYDRIRFQLNLERIKPRKYLHRKIFGR